MVGLLAIVLIAMGAGAFAFVHYSQRPVANAAISSADLPLTTRNSAAAWVAGQVAAADLVACDPVMCRALETHGMAAARLRLLWPGSENLAAPRWWWPRRPCRATWAPGWTRWTRLGSSPGSVPGTGRS